MAKSNEQSKVVEKVKSVKLQIKEINVYPDGAGVIVTVPSKSNPSENGVYRQSAGQLQRLASKCGAGSVVALKLLTQLGGSTFDMDAVEKKAGDAWENERTGETGVYQTDHIRTSNETITLSAQAIQTMLGASITAQMNQAPAVAPAQASDEPFGDDLPA